MRGVGAQRAAHLPKGIVLPKLGVRRVKRVSK